MRSLDGQRVVWQPLPRQQVALACPAFELLFGGSKGGSKTNYLVACVGPILALAHQKWLATGEPQKKCRIMVFRKNLEDIKDFIAKSFEIYPHLDPEMGADGFHVKDKFWEFTSGATVELRHLDGPTDHEGYQGNEFVAVLFDEVQYISYKAYSFLVAQVRSSDPDYRKVLMVRCTANPGGPHGDWVKRHFFVDVCPEGGKIFPVPVKNRDGKEVITKRAFVRSYLRDNPYLDPDGTYEAHLRANMNADEVRMYLDGDFDCVSGAFFSHLIKPEHFQKSRPLPDNWEMIFGIDWGASAPACCLWAALDPDGRLWFIDELHQPGITGRLFGEAMREKYKHQKWCKTRIYKPEDFWGVIDTQAMDRYGGEATAAAGIMERGFRLFPADKLPGERKVGCNQLKERLTMGRDGTPQMVIFEDRCQNLVRAFKSISSLAPADPDDYDPKSPLAHPIDSARFVAMKFPVRPQEEVKEENEVRRWERLLRRPSQVEGSDGYVSMTGGYGD